MDHIAHRESDFTLHQKHSTYIEHRHTMDSIVACISVMDLDIQMHIILPCNIKVKHGRWCGGGGGGGGGNGSCCRCCCEDRRGCCCGLWWW